MPARPKTSDEEILEATARLVEVKGRTGFSMGDVAAAVGVRAPSLFGRFASRAELLDKVELLLWHRLASKLAAAMDGIDVVSHPAEALTKQARVYRSFAKANPQGYALMFDPRSKQSEAGRAARTAALAPSAPAFVALVGEKKALAASRVLAPFLHGFVSMEISKAFRLGGDLNDAFETGVASIVQGLSLWRRNQGS